MSVLRYPGGKSRAVSHIIPYIPEDITHLYSPFFGGGSIELTCLNSEKPNLRRSNLEVVYANDKFEPLIAFWTNVQRDRDTLTKMLRSLKGTMDKTLFMKYRKDILTETDPSKRAAMYFAINRCSFSGATFSGGYSKASSDGRFTESSIKRLEDIDVSKCQFTNLDFEDFFKEYDTQLHGNGHLIYADPPYLLTEGNKLYGTNGDLHESFEHGKFRDAIVKYPNWIVSYNDCPTIREYYKDHQIIDVTWSYGMGLQPKVKTDTPDKKAKTKPPVKEILILSHSLK